MNVTIPKPNWKLKSCPRCLKGDLFREDGHYECLQCGRTFPILETLPFVERGRHKEYIPGIDNNDH